MGRRQFRRRTGRPGGNRSPKTIFWVSMFFLFIFLFVFSALWQVLPHPVGSSSGESLTDLRDRLAKKRTERKLELEEELAEWQMKNEKLKREIERLKREKAR